MNRPLDISRRAIVTATAPIALDLAMPAFVRPAKAAAIHPDAELLALREPYERTLAAMDAAYAIHGPLETAFFDLRRNSDSDRARLRSSLGLDEAEQAMDVAETANLDVILQISETPARSLEGLRFKAMISRRENNAQPELLESIVDDLMAMTPEPLPGFGTTRSDAG